MNVEKKTLKDNMANIFNTHLPKNPANYPVQSPLASIERTAEVYPDKPAVMHGNLRRTSLDTFTRCSQLASALEKHGITKGDTVAVMLPNTPPMV